MSRRAVVLLVGLLAVGGCGPKPIYRAEPLGGPDLSKVERPAESEGPIADALFVAAEPWLGTPYRYGGTTRRGVDCSALAVQLLEEVGVSLPRSVRDQRDVGREVSGESLTAGDLVFFRLGSPRVNHVGVALDADRFVHASRSNGVRIDRLDDDYYRKRLVEARRVLETSGEAP